MQIAKWRKAALEQLPELFVDGRTRNGRSEDADKDALYEEIGPAEDGTGLAPKIAGYPWARSMTNVVESLPLF